MGAFHRSFFPWDFLVAGSHPGFPEWTFGGSPPNAFLGGKKKQFQVPQGVSFIGVFSYPEK